jgi:hypothetical protein
MSDEAMKQHQLPEPFEDYLRARFPDGGLTAIIRHELRKAFYAGAVVTWGLITQDEDNVDRLEDELHAFADELKGAGE